jgi:hypothetical protein
MAHGTEATSVWRRMCGWWAESELALDTFDSDSDVCSHSIEVRFRWWLNQFIVRGIGKNQLRSWDLSRIEVEISAPEECVQSQLLRVVIVGRPSLIVDDYASFVGESEQISTSHETQLASMQFHLGVGASAERPSLRGLSGSYRRLGTR